jgi:hypothetical protein
MSAIFRNGGEEVQRRRIFARMSCKQNLHGDGLGTRNGCQKLIKTLCGGGYMRSHVPASGITQRRSRPPLRTDKKRMPLACRSRLLHPDVAEKASPLCDALPQPTGKAAEDGYLTN